MNRKNIEIGITLLLTIMMIGSLDMSVAQTTPTNADSATLVVDGSTTVQPIASKAAEVFMKMYEGYTITIKGTGSGTGIASLIAGTCDIAMASRSIKDAENTSLETAGGTVVEHTIAADGIGIVVNPANPLTGVTLNELRGIFNGTFSNWNEIGDKTHSGEIVVVNRETTSGTYGFFKETIIGKTNSFREDDQIIEKNSNGAVHDAIAATPLAIGYVGLGYIDAEVKNLELDGVAASVATVADGTYSIARDLYFYTNGSPVEGSLTYYYIQFLLSPIGQAIVKAERFVPINDVGIVPTFPEGSNGDSGELETNGIPGYTPYIMIGIASLTVGGIIFRKRN